MEQIIILVGFLGAGKTTFLKNLARDLIKEDFAPNIILNDYENAKLDAHWFKEELGLGINALTGSCVCCSGLGQLRALLNGRVEREKPITLIESNGTTDAVDLMGHLSIGISEEYAAPIQISIVNAKTWLTDKRTAELEANQVQVSSIIALTHEDLCDEARINEVKEELKRLNPYADIVFAKDFQTESIVDLKQIENTELKKSEHHHGHWSSMSIDIPDYIEREKLEELLSKIPDNVIRIKGCTRINKEVTTMVYFERFVDGSIEMRPFPGTPAFGAKLIAIGPKIDKQELSFFCR